MYAVNRIGWLCRWGSRNTGASPTSLVSSILAEYVAPAWQRGTENPLRSRDRIVKRLVSLSHDPVSDVIWHTEFKQYNRCSEISGTPKFSEHAIAGIEVRASPTGNKCHVARNFSVRIRKCPSPERTSLRASNPSCRYGSPKPRRSLPCRLDPLHSIIHLDRCPSCKISNSLNKAKWDVDAAKELTTLVWLCWFNARFREDDE